jgi:ribose/xylose/arabinose/galactoside ABC-type transport system permease subunit
LKGSIDSRTLKLIPGSLYMLMLVIIVFSITLDSFPRLSNLENILIQFTVLLLVSFGMGITILSDGIDISIGGVLSLSGVVAGILMRSGAGIFVSALMGILSSLVIGIINGIFIGKMNVPPFIATFCTMGISHGLALLISDGGSVWGVNPNIRWLVEGKVLGLPVQIYVIIVISLSFYVLLKYTSYGVGLYAIGGNVESAEYAGVPIAKYRILTYLISSFMAGFASIFLIARLNAALPRSGLGYEWDAIVVCVVGGVIFSTGKGGVFGIIIGAILIATLRNGLNLWGVSIYNQIVVTGIIMIIAYIIEIFYKRRGG